MKDMIDNFTVNINGEILHTNNTPGFKYWGMMHAMCRPGASLKHHPWPLVMTEK